MSGSVRVFLLAVFVSIMLTPLASAKDLALPVDKTIGPGLSVIKHDGTAYKIYTNETCAVSITTIDSEHVRMSVLPLKLDSQDFDIMYVQWGEFLPVFLPLSTGGSNSFLLGTETGYAEK